MSRLPGNNEKHIIMRLVLLYMLLATHVEKLWAVKNRRRAAYFSLAALKKSIDIPYCICITCMLAGLRSIDLVAAVALPRRANISHKGITKHYTTNNHLVTVHRGQKKCDKLGMFEEPK